MSVIAVAEPVVVGISDISAERARRLGNMSLLLRLANGTLREQLALGGTFDDALDWALEKYADAIAALDVHEVITRTVELSLGVLGDERARAGRPDHRADPRGLVPRRDNDGGAHAGTTWKPCIPSRSRIASTATGPAPVSPGLVRVRQVPR